MSQTDLERYTKACDYPGVLDEAAVERELTKYLRALGVKREIRRLRPGWSLDTEPALARHIDLILADFQKRLAARTALTALAAAAALTAAAQPALAGPAGHVLAAASIDQVIANITKWIVGILAGLATLFLTMGGLRYLMAGGDPSEVERAKTALRSAAIGYGLAILAPVIVTVLKSLVGG